MRDMAAITEKAMVNLFHQGGTTSLAPASSLERLGPKGSLLFLYFLNKIKLQVGVHGRELTFCHFQCAFLRSHFAPQQLMYDFGLGEIYDSGALLTRLKGDPPRDEWDMDPNHVYWNPHVDKANIPTYDYSALLYLNTLGDDFEGGEFAFLDDDADRIVQPRAVCFFFLSIQASFLLRPMIFSLPQEQSRSLHSIHLPIYLFIYIYISL